MDEQEPARQQQRTFPPNFRDVGGVPTQNGAIIRRGRVFRSSHLSGLDDTTLESLRQLGITTVCDLRWPNEIECQGRDRLDDGNTHYRYIPLANPERDGGESSGPGTGGAPRADAFFRYALESATDSIRETLETFADGANYPILVHCTNGRYRTGLIIALLLKIAGVSNDLIIRDYLLSQGQRLLTFPTGADPKLQPDDLERTFAWIDETYGDIDGFCHAIGLSEEQLAEIRRQLVER